MTVGIAVLKAYLSRQFHTKDLGTLPYFLELRLLDLRYVSVAAQVCFRLTFRDVDVGFSAI